MRYTVALAVIAFLLVSLVCAAPAAADSMALPTWEQVRRVMLLEDYNTMVVILGTTLLGCAAGMVGSFTLLRKRALMGDALSHATLPGIGLAFMTATVLGFNGKSLPVLLLGATLSGLVGVGTILVIRKYTRLKEDTALGAVLSVFFGGGIALLGVIQNMSQGHAAGLESFIYGKTALMIASDAMLIGGTTLACICGCLLLFKEFKVLCFDEGYAGSSGLPVLLLDMALMALVVIVTIVGLQSVGLILMIALLVIPAAAARFWTENLSRMFVASGVLGALGGMFGAAISALFAKLPSGAMIVLVCAGFFLFSLIFGSPRGVLVRWMHRWRLNQSVDRQHLLRAIYEILESAERFPLQAETLEVACNPVSLDELLHKRSWSPGRLQREIRRAQRNQLVTLSGSEVRLTTHGAEEAARLTRQHRLWEIYLITYADVAPANVDRSADAIEHVLEPELVAELESELARVDAAFPESPHSLATAGAETSTSKERE